jgi:hypothetical protein
MDPNRVSGLDRGMDPNRMRGMKADDPSASMRPLRSKPVLA